MTPHPAAPTPGEPRLPACLLALALLVFVAGCGSDSASSDAEAGQVESEERAVSVAAVEALPRNLSRSIRVTGSIEPIREVRLASRMSGVAVEVGPEAGEAVRQGEVVARLDVSQEEAELDRARAAQEEARATYTRTAELLEMELVSTAEYESARTALQSAESEVRLAETRVAFGTVEAPAAAVVTERLIEAGDGVSDGEVLFRLAQMDTLVVRVGIADTDAAQLAVADPVEVTVDALPGETLEGRIRRVFPTADPDSRLVTVEVELPASDEALLRPGYLARLVLDVDRREGVIALPNESLMASSAADPFVFVIDGDDRLERRSVVPGVSRQDWTQVLEGLDPGERVVGSNPAVLEEGTQVSVAQTLTHPSDPSDDDGGEEGGP